MSKASDYKELSDTMRIVLKDPENPNDYQRTLYAAVQADGGLDLNINIDVMRTGSAISPKNALALGKWLVDKFGEANEP